MAQSRAAFIASLSYQDPRAATAWLEKAFGFELAMLIEDAEGRVGHVQMTYGDSVLMLGEEWSDDHRSPRSLGGRNTQTLHVEVADLDAHYARARAAGAEIIAEPAAQFYGARTYRCRDPEGHIWTISQTVEAVSRAEAEARSGLKITAPDWK